MQLLNVDPGYRSWAMALYGTKHSIGESIMHFIDAKIAAQKSSNDGDVEKYSLAMMFISIIVVLVNIEQILSLQR